MNSELTNPEKKAIETLSIFRLLRKGLEPKAIRLILPEVCGVKITNCSKHLGLKWSPGRPFGKKNKETANFKKLALSFKGKMTQRQIGIKLGVSRQMINQIFNPEKQTTRELTKHLLKIGILPQGNKCQKCGSLLHVECHHLDYKDPTMVKWLCRKCHRNSHKYDYLNNP